jgi:hypothetical protein
MRRGGYLMASGFKKKARIAKELARIKQEEE